MIKRAKPGMLADSGTDRSDSETVRMLSDMVMSVDGRKNECMAGRHWIEVGK